MAAKQIRVSITVSKEEEIAIAQAYAEYLLNDDEHLSRNKWLKKKILQDVKE